MEVQEQYLYRMCLSCEHMDMAMDGLYSENAGAIFCVQEQYLDMDVFMLRAQGCAGAVFVQAFSLSSALSASTRDSADL